MSLARADLIALLPLIVAAGATFPDAPLAKISTLPVPALATYNRPVGSSASARGSDNPVLLPEMLAMGT